MNLFELFVKIGADTSQAEKGMKNTEKNSETLTNKIKVMSAQFEAAQKNVDKLTKEFNESVNKAGATDKATKELAKKLSDAEKEAGKFAKELDAVQKEAEQSEKALGDCNEEIKDTGEKAEKSGKGLSNFASKLGKGLATAAKIGTAAVGAASAGVVAFGASSVKTGMEFDSAMAQVAATMGKTTEEIVELRDFAQKMGSTTVFSATQSAEALNYMALAGYNSEQAMSALPTVLNLAAAGSIDLAYASDMVTDAQSALGLSMEESSIMVDQMAKTASKSNTSVAQLGEAILTVGGTASYMAGGTEQVNKVLGVLADNGIKGAEAGTHLRNMLLSLSAPTDNAQAVIDEFGLQIFDADGKMRDFAEIFPELNAAMEGLTDQEKLDAFSNLFNTRDIASATALLNTSVERWDELGRAIVDSKGAAEAMAATQLDNLAGDITLFKSALEGAQITISDQLTPTLRGFVQFGSKGLSELTEGFKEGGLSGAMEAFGSLLGEGLTMIAERLPDIVKAGASLLEAFIQGISQNSDLLVGAIFDAFESIISELPALIESFSKLVPKLIDAILKELPGLIDAIVSALTDGGVIENLTEAVVGIVQAIADNLQPIIDALVEALPSITEAVNSAILENFPALLDAIIQIVLLIVQNLPTIIQTLVDQIGPIVSTIVQVLMENLPTLIAGVAQIIFELVKALPSLTASLFDSVFSIFEGIGTGIVDAWPKFKEGMAEIWEKLTEWIGEKWDGVKDWGKDLIDNFINGIKEKWEALKQTVSDVAQSVKDFIGFSEPKKGPLSNFHTYAPDMMDLFAKGIRDNESVVTDQIAKSFDFGRSTMEFGAEYANSHGYSGSSFGGTSIENVTINISGVDVENVDQLADLIADKLNSDIINRRLAYG